MFVYKEQLRRSSFGTVGVKTHSVKQTEGEEKKQKNDLVGLPIFHERPAGVLSRPSDRRVFGLTGDLQLVPHQSRTSVEGFFSVLVVSVLLPVASPVGQNLHLLSCSLMSIAAAVAAAVPDF